MMDNNYMPYEDWHFCQEMIDKSRWIFAKRMLDNPHYYMLRRERIDEEFVRFVQLIRKYGFRMKYGHSWYTCLRVNDWYYWTMGWPILGRNDKNATILINRKECKLAPEEYVFDTIADNYEGTFADEYFVDEDVQTATLISRHNTSGRTLEIGCGTGMVTRNLLFDNDLYIGIDPSPKMLNQFCTIPQLACLKTICTDFESFSTNQHFRFIFATYGAASYVRPEFWQRLQYFLERGGSFMLMFYADDYVPLTHIYSNTDNPYFSATEFMTYCGIPVKKSRVGNYIVIDGVKT